MHNNNHSTSKQSNDSYCGATDIRTSPAADFADLTVGDVTVLRNYGDACSTPRRRSTSASPPRTI